MQLFAKAGLGMDAVMAETFSLKLEVIDSIDSMIARD